MFDNQNTNTAKMVSSVSIPVVCSVSEVGDRTGESVLLSPAPPTAVVGGLVASSPSNVEFGPPAKEESVTDEREKFNNFWFFYLELK